MIIAAARGARACAELAEMASKATAAKRIGVVVIGFPFQVGSRARGKKRRVDVGLLLWGEGGDYSLSPARAKPEAIMLQCRLLTPEEFRAADDARLALALSRTDGKVGASLVEITGPGVMWHAPWWHDPKDPEDAQTTANVLELIRLGGFSPDSYLSRWYWQDWATKRPPICVLTPNGKEWCIDAKSSNGDGWRVEGDAPLLRVTPSIDVPGYHGFLGTPGHAEPGFFSNPL